MEIIGWIGAFFLSLCGIPQAWASHRQGHSMGISKTFLWLWFMGEVFSLFYVITLGNPALIANYLVNTVAVGVILKYKHRPKWRD